MNRNRIDLWKLDPNWKFAKQHGLSTRPGKQSSNDLMRKNSILMCPCCLNIIHKQPVSLCQNPKQLSFLGYGFPLFYSMLQYCIISLFLLILSQSTILLYLSLKQDCSRNRLLISQQQDFQYACSSVFVRMSRISTDTNEFEFDRIIRSLSFIAQSFFMIYLRDVQRKLAAYHTERNTRIKDFSIIFRDLPKINGIQERLVQFLQSMETGIRLKIQDIFLMPKIDYFYELQKQKKQIIDHIKRILKNDKYQTNLKGSLQAQLQRVNLELLQTCKKIDYEYQRDQLFCQKAIIILQTKQQKKVVLEAFKKVDLKQKQKYFMWMANKVSMSSAPQPRQIIWKNINYPKYKRWFRILLGWTLSIIFLILTTVLFYLLAVLKAQSHSMWMLILSLILIQIFNKFIMKIFLHWFSDIEMPETSSQRQFSYACKYTIGMFFTTAIMTLFVQAVLYNNFYFQYGVVEGQTIMFFFNAFIVNLLWILNPFYYCRKIQRWRKFGKKNITQLQANQVMEDYPYDMGKRYAEILQTMWFTFLYASLIPFGSFLSFIGLGIYYWVDKYNLLRRSKVVNTIQSKLPLQAVKLMQFTLFWKPLGQLLFDLRLRNVFYPQTIAMLCLSVFFLFLPWNKILDTFFYQKFNVSKETYTQARFRFTQTYQTVDPIQRMLALEKFIADQNKARRQNQQKDSHTILQIRRYNSDKYSSQEAVAKQMTRQQVVPEDFSIQLKTISKNNVSTSINDEIDMQSRNIVLQKINSD